MYSDKPTSPFGTAFDLPTLEQMISVCVEWGADSCNVYVPEPYCDRVTLRFEDNKVAPASIKALKGYNASRLDPVCSADYEDGTWTFYLAD